MVGGKKIKTVSWLALALACIAIALNLTLFSSLSNRVKEIETTVTEHSALLTRIEIALGEFLVNFTDPSCEIPDIGGRTPKPLPELPTPMPPPQE